jgi:hypothetical protein
MLDQVSGRVLHIDFGDCFEVAMHREKFPEKVPFRLTRMLVRAMEVSGIEGSYKSTCERTMAVLRDNKDSLVAMLEAFVYDPLISWRLLSDEDEVEADVDAAANAPSEDEPSSVDDSTVPQQDSAATAAASTGASHANTTLPEPIQEGNEEDEQETSDSFGALKDSLVYGDGDNEESDSEHEDVNGDKKEDADDNNMGGEEETEEVIDVRAELNSEESNDDDKKEASVGGGSSEKDEAPSEEMVTTIPPLSETPHSTAEASTSIAASNHARSLQMYSEMKALAANLSTSSRIASITGGGVSAAAAMAMEGSVARSRAARSLRHQRELLRNSVANNTRSDGGSSSNRGEGEEDAFGNNDEALNEKALKVIRRVQDKLTGTDFHSSDEDFVGEPLDVQEQVQRLIVQATSSENLSQLFIGWCAFW